MPAVLTGAHAHARSGWPGQVGQLQEGKESNMSELIALFKKLERGIMREVRTRACAHMRGCMCGKWDSASVGT
jgi:hypothetical protein